MPWEAVDRGDFSDFTEKVKQLIALRKTFFELRGNELKYEIDTDRPRLLQYTKGGSIRVILNATEEAIRVNDSGEILFANCFDHDILHKDGVLIIKFT